MQNDTVKLETVMPSRATESSPAHQEGESRVSGPGRAGVDHRGSAAAEGVAVAGLRGLPSLAVGAGCVGASRQQQQQQHCCLSLHTHIRQMKPGVTVCSNDFDSPALPSDEWLLTTAVGNCRLRLLHGHAGWLLGSVG